MESMTLNAEGGMRNAEFTPSIPNSEFRIPNAVVGLTELLLLGFLFVWPARVMACPLCKEALFDPGQMHQRLATAKGYALSIALLLSVPAALVAGVTALIVRAHKRNKHV